MLVDALDIAADAYNSNQLKELRITVTTKRLRAYTQHIAALLRRTESHDVVSSVVICTKKPECFLALTRLNLQLVQPFLDFRWARMLCDILSLRYSLRYGRQTEAGVVWPCVVTLLGKVRGSPLFHAEGHAAVNPTLGRFEFIVSTFSSTPSPNKHPCSTSFANPESRRAVLQTPAAFFC